MKFAVVSGVFFLCYLLAACNNFQSPKHPLATVKDIEACGIIYQHSLFAIKAAKEAITRSTSPHTKTLAHYFKNRNQTIKNEFEEFAGRKRFNLPLDIDQKQMQDWEFLVKQKGWNFDKVFVEMVSSLDSKEHSILEKMAKESSDTTVRKIAVRLLYSQNISKEEHEIREAI